MSGRSVFVVTPSRNAEQYLEQTILSVVQQRGEFEIHYHVQDGGSTDSTPRIVADWVERLRAMDGRFYGGPRIHLSYAVARDRSMYDAIQTGFESLLKNAGADDRRTAVMTWINADDVFAPGAFQTATRFLAENPDRYWLTGIPSIIIEDGSIGDVRDPPYVYAQEHLALGRYDGRRRPFFQQEGTFWTNELWSSVGGLNRDLLLAGDWDLWRRMAEKTSVVTLRAVLAHHRRHSRQLTTTMDSYWREVDSVRGSLRQPAERVLAGGDVAWAAGWNPPLNRWTLYEVDIGGEQELFHEDGDEASRGMRIEFSNPAMPGWVRHVSGLSPAEHWGRWSDANLAPSVRICSKKPFATKGLLRIRLAVADGRCNPVVVTVGTQRFELDVPLQPVERSVTMASETPTDTIDIHPAISVLPNREGWSDDNRRLGAALHSLEIISLPDSR